MVIVGCGWDRVILFLIPIESVINGIVENGQVSSAASSTVCFPLVGVESSQQPQTQSTSTPEQLEISKTFCHIATHTDVGTVRTLRGEVF